MQENDDEEDEFQRGNAPRKYVPLREVYSATEPKKVKPAANKPPIRIGRDQLEDMVIAESKAYLRRWRRERANFLVAINLDSESEELEEEGGVKRRRIGKCTDELMKLDEFKKSRTKKFSRKNRESGRNVVDDSVNKKRKKDSSSSNSKKFEDEETKKWMWLSFEGADPMKFVGLTCKVYWPLDAIWYSGHVVDYNSKTGRHNVKYEDGEEENLVFSKERIKFYISFKEMQSLKLKCREKSSEADTFDVDEMMALAAALDDGQETEPGDLIWAKLTGHAIWPAIVLDKSHVAQREGLNNISGEESVQVQFFGTHDFARIKPKKVTPFVKGLFSSCHAKCKKPAFVRGLEEAKMYLSERKLPEKMLQLRDGVETYNNDSGSGEHENGSDSSDEECLSHDDIRKKLEDLKNCPLEAGELQVISLGKIVKDSDYFQNGKFTWPEGYTAVRKFPSITDPSVDVLYKMEVLRDVDSRTRPLFIVTTDNGEEFKGSTPTACWNKIYKRLRAVQNNNRDYKARQNFESGSYMFGFSHSKVSKLIKEMSNSRASLKSSELSSRRDKNKFIGYRAVRIEWKDLDKCNVCHMDEEYENNLFLQCDKCRMMVHAKCYGELEPSGGVLWLCNLCRPGAPKSPPPCCLCPVVGGAMKPTTDGRWAHLACAIWIPETCLSDIKKMEPIDGLRRINKDRWKLLCSICGVSHGACIQCSNNTCRVAYHPLCARAAGFCLEAEGVDKLHMVSLDEDEVGQCIQLLSYCRKHMPSYNECPPSDERFGQRAHEHAEFTAQPNPSGCARTEPYNFLRKRGRNEPEALAAASSKRLYVENQPYLVAGCSPNMPLWNKKSNSNSYSKYSDDFQKLQNSRVDTSSKILSVADKYNYMKETLKTRLAFGKSSIHGYGVFAKYPHRAGDMVIEYTGELIRRTVADRREHLIYNKLVGAGTYMFGINDEYVIDATRSGSIAHLINHSCEPNCHSIVKAINGVDHIIIFAKRDIKQWEELTYDYRFASTDERLACHCGSSRCRGVVNNEEQKQLYVPRSELIDWKGE
ncbi:hypothetical protein RD792_004916 [Penstemon davidsonii]|uniref:Uncharacterized protein n=1 Tax=Penstemon davidsonii TaxID=160366 RepID=A0ABR0DIS8_9LAMI|nr:hypothetical protein RD792_004916 [Penstemon davidsonii]